MQPDLFLHAPRFDGETITDAVDGPRLDRCGISYDAKQMGAALTVCSLCERAFWMTEPALACIACRRKFPMKTEAKVPYTSGAAALEGSGSNAVFNTREVLSHV